MAVRLTPRALWRATSATQTRTFIPAFQTSRTFASTSALQATKTAIVTGSSRGIGKAIALRLASDGYDITINDIPANEQGVHDVVQEIKSLGRNACGAIADVSDASQVEQMIQKSVEELGPLDTMVANAGIAQVKPLLELTTEDWMRMLSINVMGVQNCFSMAAKQIIRQGTAKKDNPAKLVSAASIVAHKPFAMLSHYSASKWAVRGLTQAYAMELAEHQITANSYCPGIVGTAMWDLIDEELGKSRGEKLGEVIKKGETIKKYTDELIALGRVSVPEDVAKVVSFLCSRDADYMTGQSVVIDGGIIFT